MGTICNVNAFIGPRRKQTSLPSFRPVDRENSQIMTTQTATTNSEDSTSNGPEQMSRSTWGVVAGASFISTGLAAYEIVPASVTPLIQDALNIGPTIAGFLVSIMFGTAVIASLPTGAVLDRTNSCRVE